MFTIFAKCKKMHQKFDDFEDALNFAIETARSMTTGVTIKEDGKRTAQVASNGKWHFVTK